MVGILKVVDGLNFFMVLRMLVVSDIFLVLLGVLAVVGSVYSMLVYMTVVSLSTFNIDSPLPIMVLCMFSVLYGCSTLSD